MPKITRGWPPDRRKKQAETIRKTKPWANSTGPRTAKGKNACRLNSLKHGMRRAETRAFIKLMRQQRQFIKTLCTLPEDSDKKQT